MDKNLDYYLSLPYTIEVVPIPKEDGGGYMATLPQIGRFAITGDGETPEEAIKNLQEKKAERFAEYFERNISIPEPEPEEEEYSGRFVVRIPKSLHRQLVEKAKENQVSLNQFVSYLLSSQLQLESLDNSIQSLIASLGRNIYEIKSEIPGFRYTYSQSIYSTIYKIGLGLEEDLGEEQEHAA